MDVVITAYNAEIERIEQSTIKTLRQELLKSYVPEIVECVISEGQSTRNAFRAVSLRMGLSESYVQQIYYIARTPR